MSAPAPGYSFKNKPYDVVFSITEKPHRYRYWLRPLELLVLNVTVFFFFKETKFIHICYDGPELLNHTLNFLYFFVKSQRCNRCRFQY